MQLFDSAATRADDQDHYLLLADGFVLVYEITSKASFDLITTIRQKISSKNKEVRQGVCYLSLYVCLVCCRCQWLWLATSVTAMPSGKSIQTPVAPGLGPMASGHMRWPSWTETVSKSHFATLHGGWPIQVSRWLGISCSTSLPVSCYPLFEVFVKLILFAHAKLFWAWG